jgi:hypothetical protein
MGRKENIMGELRFTASVRVAIYFMSQLVSEGRIHAKSKGMEIEAPKPETWLTEMVKPFWVDFYFFHRIKPGKIQRTKKVSPPDKGEMFGEYWELFRKVEFYHLGKLVAIVELVGRDYGLERHGASADDSTQWKISKVGYFTRFDRRPPYASPQYWREVAFDVS